MDAEPRYALAVLDQVFAALGCVGGPRGRAWVWKRRGASGHASYFSYVPDRGCPWIRQDHVVAAAVHLGFEPHDVLRRLKDAGGEILDPA